MKVEHGLVFQNAKNPELVGTLSSLLVTKNSSLAQGGDFVVTLILLKNIKRISLYQQSCKSKHLPSIW